MKRMKREHCDIIIRVQKGKFVKLYANGKWQKGVQPSIFMHHAVMLMEDLFNANLKTLRLIKTEDIL